MHVSSARRRTTDRRAAHGNGTAFSALAPSKRPVFAARQSNIREWYCPQARIADRLTFRPLFSSSPGRGFARHKALSARRRRTDAELDEKIEATVADTANDPEAALQEKHRGELLRQALTRLSPEHREIIDLVYYHEKSVEECAQVLGIPAATVKTRMFYARKKLAEMVQAAGFARRIADAEIPSRRP
jgi:RNA polymerase sigma factor (sigma-70 family)